MTALNRRVRTRVGALAVADHGEGEPVLLWPSLLSDPRLYPHVTEALDTGWRTICVDGPGFGRSDAPDGDVQPDRYAGAVDGTADGDASALDVGAGVASGSAISVTL